MAESRRGGHIDSLQFKILVGKLDALQATADAIKQSLADSLGDAAKLAESIARLHQSREALGAVVAGHQPTT